MFKGLTRRELKTTSTAAFFSTGNPNNEFIPRCEKYSAENRQTPELNSKLCILHKDLNALRYVYDENQTYLNTENLNAPQAKKSLRRHVEGFLKFSMEFA
ncbi:MAG: hypothetical protein IKP64_03320 [Selenomonadaceae bacterium]|nr:hypothetical protein [Selenomonadaceae bacterium]MBR4382568.1 hypothetical protein [Selenomonadaceae bacterium]